MPEYETLAGTEANMDEQHDARTIQLTTDDGTVYMMTEIGDGTFVQWGGCHRCHLRVNACTCPDGPQEPPHIERWRINRFTDSFAGRGVEPALPTLLKTRKRRIDAVLRLLRSQGWTITTPRGDTLASDELRVENLSEVQREMLDQVRSEPLPTAEEVIELGKEKLHQYHPSLARMAGLNDDGEPDIIDPDDVEGLSDDPDYGGHVEAVDTGLDAALEAAKQRQKEIDDVGF